MFTPIFSVRTLLGFGCPNALTVLVWNQFFKMRTFAGSFSMRTAYCLEHRGRAARSMHLAIRRPARRLLRATVIQAGRFGAHREVTLATLLTVNFIATPDSIFHWNTWGQLARAPGNFHGKQRCQG